MMANQSVTVLCGIALLLGGTIHALASLFHLNNGDPGSVKNRLWTPLQITFAISFLLMGVGVLGLQLRQGDRAGWLGLLGVGLASLGSLLTTTTSFMWAFVAPYLARQEPTPRAPNDLLGPKGAIPGVFQLLLTYIFILLPGFILTALTTILAGELPALAGWLVLIGIIVSQPGNMVARLAILRNVGGVLFGTGLAWLGWTLLSG
jgi:hypothetical protein